MSSSRFSTLDSLRGVFALSVVLWHCDNHLLPFNWAGQLWYDHLYLAVDFFFCLSGFVIAHNYNNNFNISFCKTFLRRRLGRIYPLLLYSTIVYGIFRMTALILMPDTLSSRTDWLAVIQDYLNTLLMVNSTPLLGVTHGMNVPSWSISGEFIAYLLFASLALSKRRTLAWILAIICAAILFSAVGAKHDASNDWGFLRSTIGFGYGVLTSAFFQRSSTQPNKLRLNSTVRFTSRFLALFAIAIAFHLAESNSHNLVQILGIDFAFALVIFLCAAIPNIGGSFLNNPVTAWLGDISYSVYLNHLIVLVIFERGLVFVVGTNPSTIAKLISLLLALSTILIYSHLTRRHIEARFNRRTSLIAG